MRDQRLFSLCLSLSDTERNGSISWNEFVSFQFRSRDVLDQHWPLELAELRNEFRQLDADGNGTIERAEFMHVSVSSQLH